MPVLPVAERRDFRRGRAGLRRGDGQKGGRPLPAVHLSRGFRLRPAAPGHPLRRRHHRVQGRRRGSSTCSTARPILQLDRKRCIQCHTCVRVCDELERYGVYQVDEAGYPALKGDDLPGFRLRVLRPVHRRLPDRRSGQRSAQRPARMGDHPGPHHLPALRHRLQLRPERQRRQGRRGHHLAPTPRSTAPPCASRAASTPT